jgi:hypothetical protein
MAERSVRPSGRTTASAVEPLRHHRLEHPERGTKFPTGTGVPFQSMKENIMSAVHVTRVLRPVGVLLGGSGLARMLLVPAPQAAALTRSLAPTETQAQEGHENRAGAGLFHEGSHRHVA